MSYRKPTEKQLIVIEFIEDILGEAYSFTGKTMGQAGKFIRLHKESAIQVKKEIDFENNEHCIISPDIYGL